MIELLRPAFLFAGALLALIPPVLHLIARRPPERAPLPTARFLRPDPRTSVRVRRRPSDLLLLLLRSMLLLLLGAAFAGLSLAPERTGTVELVLLDRGRGMTGAWASAVDSARGVLLSGGLPQGELVLFDTAAVHIPARRLSPEMFDSLGAAGPALAPVDYAAALRGLRATARALRNVDSIRVLLITRPRWEGWSPGLSRLRRSAWPGAIRIVSLPPADRRAAPDRLGGPADRGRAAVLAPRGGGIYLEAALRALGWQVVEAQEGQVRKQDLYLVLRALTAAEQRTLLRRARAGAAVVVAGVRPGVTLGAALPWTAVDGGEWSTRGVAAQAPPTGTIVFADGPTLAGAAFRARGTARPDARVIAVWGDGRPAAAAAPVGTGCLVFLSTPLEGGRLPLASDFPAAISQLAAACETWDRRLQDGASRAGALDRRLQDGASRAVPSDRRPHHEPSPPAASDRQSQGEALAPAASDQRSQGKALPPVAPDRRPQGEALPPFASDRRPQNEALRAVALGQRSQGQPSAAAAQDRPPADLRSLDLRPLDNGALAILERAGARASISAAAALTGVENAGSDRAERPTGRPLARWILLAALGVAVAETFVAYARRSSSGAVRSGRNLNR